MMDNEKIFLKPYPGKYLPMKDNKRNLIDIKEQLEKFYREKTNEQS
jgi:hypothetical protein